MPVPRASALLPALVLAGCAATGVEPERLDDGLPVASPASQGMDVALLRRAGNSVFEFDLRTATPMLDHAKDYMGIESILVSRHGTLVYEEYFNGASRNQVHPTRSAGKSIVSAMIGIGIAEGYLGGVDDSLYRYLPYKSYAHWDERKAGITLEHLLTMTTGWDCGAMSELWEQCGTVMEEQPDPYKWVLDLPMAAAPGEVFNYNDATPKFLTAALAIAARKSVAELYYEHLMKPMGLEVNLFLDDGTTSRELMKLGILYLNEGRWDGRQLIPAEWVRRSTRAHVSWQRDGRPRGYGYMWWLRPFEVNGRLYDSYHAAGNGGQFIFVVPELDVVAVFTGMYYADFARMRQPFEIMEQYVLASITDPPVE